MIRKWRNRRTRKLNTLYSIKKYLYHLSNTLFTNSLFYLDYSNQAQINWKPTRLLGNLFHFLLQQFFLQHHLFPHPVGVCMYGYLCVLILAALCCLSALSRSVRLAGGDLLALNVRPSQRLIEQSGLVCVGRTAAPGTAGISPFPSSNATTVKCI